MDWFLQRRSRHLAQIDRHRRFCLDLNPPAGTPLAVVIGGVERCVRGYENIRESFPFFTLELVATGTGELVLAGRAHPLRTGSVFTYGPGIPHAIRNDGPRPFSKYFFGFIGDEAAKLLDQAGLPPGTCAGVRCGEPVLSAADALLEAGLAGTARSVPACALLLRALLLNLTDQLVAPGPAGQRALETFRNAQAVLDERFLELKNLAQFAAACRIDAAYLCRLYKRFTGRSPLQCLLQARMRHAAGLLQNRKLLVRQVAELVGYRDPYQFSRLFKRVLGVSPERFGELFAGK